ncbi:proline-rich protein HaeIII subfamily 1-like [Sagmatias obliquidens]|uniref:proline-rich protein HaeIII subfamily 1-like n=1 Tax=Sagmatias obliquidens TaxID=3371155 RepID=UPI000F43E645|nr:proline-rich protein HaeIII subfamily 1-like [Lagenorhynchus obliquidens]
MNVTGTKGRGATGLPPQLYSAGPVGAGRVTAHASPRLSCQPYAVGPRLPWVGERGIPPPPSGPSAPRGPGLWEFSTLKGRSGDNTFSTAQPRWARPSGSGERPWGRGGRCPCRPPRPHRRQEEEAAGPRGAGVPWLREARDLVRPKVDLTGCQPRTPPPPPPGSLSPGAGPDGRPRSPAQPPIGPYAAWRSAFAPGSGSHWPRVAQSPSPAPLPLALELPGGPPPHRLILPLASRPPPRPGPPRFVLPLASRPPPRPSAAPLGEPSPGRPLGSRWLRSSSVGETAFTSLALVPRLFSSPSIYCLPYVSLPALLPSLREPESRARGHPAPLAPPTLGLRVQRCPRSPSCSFPPPLSSSLRHFAFSFLP